MILETKRLILRPWEDSDAESLYVYAKDPEVGPIAGWPPHTSVENSLWTIQNVLRNPESYAVVLKERNEVIGSISILTGESSNLKLTETEAEIGYWIGVPFWGQGLIPEAIKEVLRHAFMTYQYTSIWCGYFEGNTKSKRAQEKCGFHFQRIEKDIPWPLMNDIRTEYITCITKEEWEQGYRVVDLSDYYRKGVYTHFTKDCRCSTSMTASIDVTKLIENSKRTNTEFYINFLYALGKVLNSREDYRMQYLYEKNELIVYEKINPCHYIFHDDTETCTVAYTEFEYDYHLFYKNVMADIERAKQTREYGLDQSGHPNYFDASYISWISYDSLNIELPDGYPYYLPIVNWGRYRKENESYKMPVSIRLNHAVADGYLVANVLRKLEQTCQTEFMDI